MEEQSIDIDGAGSSWRRLPDLEDGVRRLLLVTIDSEEEGRWGGRYPRHGNPCANISFLEALNPLFREFQIRPTYLVDFPVATDGEAVNVLRRRVDREGAEIGAHLHPWCNPPYVAADERGETYAGRLPQEDQHAKLEVLSETIERAFGRWPTSYRAGSWGLSTSTVAVLESLGFQVDSSITPLRWEVNPDGPSWMRAPAYPYLLGANRVDRPGSGPVLEIPTSIGMVGLAGRSLTPLLQRLPRLPGVQGLLERCGRTWLRPSSHSDEVLRRATDEWCRRNWPVLNIMFHSSELMPGGSPYVRDKSDLDRFLQRLRVILETAMDHEGTRPVTLENASRRILGIRSNKW